MHTHVFSRGFTFNVSRKYDKWIFQGDHNIRLPKLELPVLR